MVTTVFLFLAHLWQNKTTFMYFSYRYMVLQDGAGMTDRYLWDLILKYPTWHVVCAACVPQRQQEQQQ